MLLLLLLLLLLLALGVRDAVVKGNRPQLQTRNVQKSVGPYIRTF
jgi:hypothetical protein